MKEQGIRRHISWYEKKGDDFIDDEDMVNINLNALQKLFNVGNENPMYDCWEIKEKHVKALQKHINHKINIEKYDYFVEATALN